MSEIGLIEFLISRGGVADDMGDLRGMDLHMVNKGWFGRLVHSKGRRLDYAREAAEEAGYLRPGSTISDLIEAIRDQVSFGRGYTAEARYDRHLERRAEFMDPREWDQDMQEIGDTPDDFRVWRATMGWTQERAADELGLTRRTIIAYEMGKQPIPRTVQLACLALTLTRK